MGTFYGYEQCQLKFSNYISLVRPHLNHIPKDVLETMISKVTNEIVADWNRTAQKHLSRKQPVVLGRADRLDSKLPAAKIVQIDSATREGLVRLMPLSVQAIQFRTYIPEKPAARGEKSHTIDVTKQLVCTNNWVSGEEYNLIATKNLLNSKFDTEGMLLDPLDYAQSICLAYANMHTKEDKYVLMLRPQKHLNKPTYRLYCGAVLFILTGKASILEDHSKNITEEQAGCAIISDLVLSKQATWNQVVCKKILPFEPATWTTFCTTESNT